MNNLKKYVFVLVGLMVSIIGGIYLSSPAWAVECGGVETALINCNNTGAGSIRETLLLVVDFLSMGIGILGVMGIVIFGIQWMTARDSQQQTTKAKRRLFGIVIGLVAYAGLFGLAQWLLPGGELGETVEVVSVSLGTRGTDVHVGSEMSLTPILDPIDADNYSYTWESSDESIAVVNIRVELNLSRLVRQRLQ